MHTSFEDISAKEGHIYRVNEEGEWIWERPRTRREAGYQRIAFYVALAAAAATPIAVALVFLLT